MNPFVLWLAQRRRRNAISLSLKFPVGIIRSRPRFYHDHSHLFTHWAFKHASALSYGSSLLTKLLTHPNGPNEMADSFGAPPNPNPVNTTPSSCSLSVTFPFFSLSLSLCFCCSLASSACWCLALMWATFVPVPTNYIASNDWIARLFQMFKLNFERTV